MVGKCSATKKDGTACSGVVWSDGFCWFHHPGEAEKRAASRRQGGSARSNRARARKQAIEGALAPSEIGAKLGKALTDVLAGTIEPGVANAAANLGRAIVVVREATDVDARLDALEQVIARYGDERRRA